MRRRDFLAALTLGPFVGCDRDAPRNIGADVSGMHGSTNPRGGALTIGLNEVIASEYDGVTETLCGAENDAAVFHELVKAQGYRKPRLLVGHAADYASVVAGIREVKANTRSDETACIYFSGHGSQALTTEDRSEQGQFDQTWCLRDRPLLDNELYWLLQELEAGCKVVVVSDSCFSGDITKLDADLWLTERTGSADNLAVRDCARKVRSIPAFIASVVNARAALTSELRRDPPPKTSRVNVGLLAASAYNEEAYEVDGHGVFTKALLDSFHALPCKQSYSALHADVVRRMRPYRPADPTHLKPPDWTDWFGSDYAFCGG